MSVVIDCYCRGFKINTVTHLDCYVSPRTAVAEFWAFSAISAKMEFRDNTLMICYRPFFKIIGVCHTIATLASTIPSSCPGKLVFFWIFFPNLSYPSTERESCFCLIFSQLCFPSATWNLLIFAHLLFCWPENSVGDLIGFCVDTLPSYWFGRCSRNRRSLRETWEDRISVLLIFLM